MKYSLPFVFVVILSACSRQEPAKDLKDAQKALAVLDNAIQIAEEIALEGATDEEAATIYARYKPIWNALHAAEQADEAALHAESGDYEAAAAAARATFYDLDQLLAEILPQLPRLKNACSQNK